LRGGRFDKRGIAQDREAMHKWRNRLIVAAMVTVGATPCAAAADAPIEVTVLGVDSARGKVHVDICSEGEFH
jgi:hypothetical protein